MARNESQPLKAAPPGTWTRASLAMNPSPDIEPEALREHIAALQQDILDRRCPRDRTTIVATTGYLRAAKAIFEKKSRDITTAKSEVAKVVFSRSVAVLAAIALATCLAAIGGKLISPTIAVLTMAAVTGLVIIAAIVFVSKSDDSKAQKNHDETVKHYETLLKTLEGQIDDSNDYLRDRSGRWVSDMTGTPKHLARLASYDAEIDAFPSRDEDAVYAAMLRIMGVLPTLKSENMTDEYEAKLTALQARVDEKASTILAVKKRGISARAKEEGAALDLAARTNVRVSPDPASASATTPDVSANHAVAEDGEAPCSVDMKRERKS